MSKLILISAPSGTGKSTLIAQLMRQAPDLHLSFSISATSREPRGGESHGVEYYFLSSEAFRNGIDQGDFIEYEEVYKGVFYGTLRAEVERIFATARNVLFDVDVVGALHIKQQYKDQALAIFILPPSLQTLRQRLTDRSTDAPYVIEERLAKAQIEIEKASLFDIQLTNDDLARCCQELEEVIRQFLQSPNILNTNTD